MMRPCHTAFAGLLALAGPALSQPASEGGWAFTLTPYFMAPSMDGKIRIGPLGTNVSTNPAEIFRNLNWGAMAMAELTNGRFGFMVDVTYMSLGTHPQRFLDRIEGHQGAYAAMALVRVGPHAEAYAGARMNDLGVGFTLTGPLGAVRSARAKQQWVDPLVGMRVNLPLGGTTDFTMMADVGGFGAGSDIAVQAWPAIGFRLGGKARAQLGYRMVYMQYQTGEGLNRFDYDMLTHGPTAGIRLTF